MKAFLLAMLLAVPSFGQTVIGASAPQLAGTGSPVSVYPCTAPLANLSYIQTDATNGRLWLCDFATGEWAWEHLMSPVSGFYLNGVLQPAAKCSFLTGTTSAGGTITFNISGLGLTSIIGQPQPSVLSSGVATSYITAVSTTAISVAAMGGVTVSIVGINATVFTAQALPVGVFFCGV